MARVLTQTVSLDSRPQRVPTVRTLHEPAVHRHSLITCLNMNFFSVGTTTPFHGSGCSSSLPSMLKGQPQPYAAPHNPLDSTAPRVKRGKERELPKVKRPTALKKVSDLNDMKTSQETWDEAVV